MSNSLSVSDVLGRGIFSATIQNRALNFFLLQIPLSYEYLIIEHVMFSGEISCSRVLFKIDDRGTDSSYQGAYILVILSVGFTLRRIWSLKINISFSRLLTKKTADFFCEDSLF